ncbi:MAG: ADP-ribosylglycohydrolase family protein [Caldilineaceae bacterium]|nr:ADP-ribosylglycohydrolase family protein [Caldilineaceae bacterium]
MSSDSRADKERQRYRDRALGCMVGLAAGDALGDLGRKDEYRQRYGIVTNLYDGAGSTDDTEFALLTARALIDCKGNLTTGDVVGAWCKYVLEQGGVLARGGRPQYGAAANLKRGLRPPLSGRDNVGYDDDGAAMRVAPIGIVCAGDPARAARLAAIDAQVSHYADGIWAAQAVAASVAEAMTGASPDAVLTVGRAQIPEDSWLGRAMQRAMSICDEAETIEGAWERLHTELWTPSHSTCAEAIPQAYAIFRLTRGDFRRGMFWAANFGRDADTISAIVGAFCGARQGIGVIPDDWVGAVRKPSGVCLRFAAEEDVVAVAEALAQLIA